MNLCPECLKEMTEKALFTSTYYECDFCIERLEYLAEQAAKALNTPEPSPFKELYVNGIPQPIVWDASKQQDDDQQDAFEFLDSNVGQGW